MTDFPKPRICAALALACHSQKGMRLSEAAPVCHSDQSTQREHSAATTAVTSIWKGGGSHSVVYLGGPL
jgi:hypothetical protein